MISDAVHSASDVFSTFIVMIGVQISSKQSDADHQYGHERMECVASIVLAVVLCITGLGIGYGGLKTIFGGNYETLVIPGRLALAAAVLSIAVRIRFPPSALYSVFLAPGSGILFWTAQRVLLSAFSS